MNGITVPRKDTEIRLAVSGSFDTRAYLNSQRFRGNRVLDPRPSPGILRIATIGDSFTFGWGANDGQDYPAQLERLLNSRLPAGSPIRTVEVINAGISASGTGEQALWYDIWVKDFHPHLVILMVFQNDVEDDLVKRVFQLDERGRAFPRPIEDLQSASRSYSFAQRASQFIPGHRFLSERSHLYNLIRSAVSNAVAKSRQTAEVGAHIDRQLFEQIGLPLFSGEILWLNSAIRKQGSRLLIVNMPDRELIQPDTEGREKQEDKEWIRARSSAILKRLEAVSREHGIPFLDLTSLFVEFAHRQRKTLYYLHRDRHLNPEGYAIAAEIISSHLLKMELLQSGN